MDILNRQSGNPGKVWAFAPLLATTATQAPPVDGSRWVFLPDALDSGAKKSSSRIGGSLRPQASPGAPPGFRTGRSVVAYDEQARPIGFEWLNQGQTNACGTTSMAMMLNLITGRAKPYTRGELDQAIRPLDTFTAPTELQRFARAQGLDVNLVNGLSLDSLKAIIDQGLPVQILIDASPGHDGSALHYVLVTGYGIRADGSPALEVADPAAGRYLLSEVSLLRQWQNLRLAGMELGFDQFALVATKPGHPIQIEAQADQTPATPALRIAAHTARMLGGIGHRRLDETFAGLAGLIIEGPGALFSMLTRPTRA